MAKQGSLGFLTEIRRKDALTFARDPSQWAQLILLAALVAIYLLNFGYMKKLGEGGIIGPTGMYFTNLGLAGFVVAAISVRFVFPMVSLEGRSFWLVRTAPVSAKRFLRAKWAAAGSGIWLFTILLLMTSSFMIESGSLLTICALIMGTTTAVGVVGLGIGIGAMYPKFNETNAAKVAVGIGGFTYMVVGVGTTITAVVLSVHPTLVLVAWLEGIPPSAQSTALGAVLGVVALGLPLVSALMAMRLGATRLERDITEG